LPASCTLATVATQALQRILRAGMRSQFAMLGFAELETLVGLERGVRFRPGIFINFRPFDDSAGSRPVTPAGLRQWDSLLGTSEFSVTRHLPEPRRDYDMYFKVSPTDEGLVLTMIAGDAVLGGRPPEQLLRDLERVLVQFAADGDLTHGQIAAAVRTPRADPGDGWAMVDHSWVSLLETERLLRAHPAVREVSVSAAGAGLTASAVTHDTHLVAADLRRHLLSQLDLNTAVVCPAHFEIYRRGGRIDGGPGTGRAARVPSGAAETALCQAVITANRLASVSVTDNYVAAGGMLRRLPAVCDLLAEAGFAGLSVEDFRRPWELSHVAARLIPSAALPPWPSGSPYRWPVPRQARR
jgi:hypothetical protein